MVRRRVFPGSRRVGCRTRTVAPQRQGVEISIIERILIIGGFSKYRHPVGMTLQGQEPSRREKKSTWSVIYTLFDKGKDAREAEAEDSTWTLNT